MCHSPRSLSALQYRLYRTFLNLQIILRSLCLKKLTAYYADTTASKTGQIESSASIPKVAAFERLYVRSVIAKSSWYNIFQKIWAFTLEAMVEGRTGPLQINYCKFFHSAVLLIDILVVSSQSSSLRRKVKHNKQILKLIKSDSLIEKNLKGIQLLRFYPFSRFFQFNTQAYQMCAWK